RSGMASPDLAAESGERRLLVPLDGSPTAELALPAAADLAQALGAEILLVRVVPSSPASITREPIRFLSARQARPSDAYELEAEQYLQGVARRLEADGRRVSTA